MSKQFLQFDEVSCGVQNIISQMIANEFIPDVVVGIVRGGLVPAVMVSHQLSVPIMPVTHQLRDGNVVTSQDLLDAARDGAKILIVDDICDSGATYKTMEERYGLEDCPNVRWAAVIDKKFTHNFELDYFGFQAIDDEDVTKWVVFPWEKQE